MKRSLVLLALSACTSDTTPRWQLHHDRVIAVRTTPSHVPADQTAVLDALVTSVDGGLAVESPTTAGVAAGTPAALADLVHPDGHGGWQVTAPDAATLVAARTALGLAADAPVPVLLTAQFAVGGQTLAATKQAWLGDARDNPAIGAVTVAGTPPPPSFTVPFDTDVALAVDAPTSQRANWLTSCGSLNVDDNEHAAILHVDPDDAQSGQLALVIRDDGDGVAWQSWQLSSSPQGSANR